MRVRSTYIVMAFLLAALFIAGCTDKTPDNPTRSVVTETGLMFKWPLQFECILTATVFDAATEDPSLRGVHVYMPPGYDPLSPGRPYPVLYLLSPFQADDLYYNEHGLAEVADRLIQEGTIQPMIIVTFDGRSLLGGSFYANSTRQGNYFTALVKDTAYYDIDWEGIPVDVFCNSLITRVDVTFPTIAESGARAIGGVGMGGYGAFATVLRSDLFSAVSAVNAPLDFDGGGDGGFRTLIRNNVIPGMTWPIDTAKSDPSTSLIVSASSAFSPQVTVFDSIWYFNNDVSGVRTFGYDYSDSLTDDMRSYLPFHQSHAPIDSTGAFNEFIWDIWMDHNIQNLYEDDAMGYAAAFPEMPKLLVQSNDPVFNYGDQMNAFRQFLNANAMSYDLVTFRHNEKLDGTADNFLYDLLKDILVFHSDNFVIPSDL